LGWEIAMIRKVDLNKAFAMVEKTDIKPRVWGSRLIEDYAISSYPCSLKKKAPVIKSKADSEEKKAPWE
jgi:hypothetical protein